MPAKILQFEGSIVTPKDDAVMYEIFNEQSGVVRGCSLTYMGTNQIKVGAGYVYACGRLVKIEEETILSPFASDENGVQGELILKIDLLSDTPAKLIARTPRQELTKEDINGDGDVYEYLMASYTVTDVAISGLTIEYEVISAGFSKDKILTTLAEIEVLTEPGYIPDALALKEVSAKLEDDIDYDSGSFTISTLNGGTSGHTVTFKAPFKNIPTVSYSANSSQGIASDSIEVSRVGFTYTCKGNYNNITKTITWNAYASKVEEPT